MPREPVRTLFFYGTALPADRRLMPPGRLDPTLAGDGPASSSQPCSTFSACRRNAHSTGASLRGSCGPWGTAARSVFPCNVSLHRIRVGSIMAHFRGVAAMNRIRNPKRWFLHLFCALTNKDRQSNRRIQLQTATPYGNGERRNEPEKSFACERRV